MGRSYGRIDPVTGHDYMRVEGDTTPCDEQQRVCRAKTKIDAIDATSACSLLTG